MAIKDTDMDDTVNCFQDSPHKLLYDEFIESEWSALIEIILNSCARSCDAKHQISYKVEVPKKCCIIINKQRIVWDSSGSGKTVIESFPGYLHIEVPVEITFESGCESLTLSLRKLPLLNDDGTFWWGEAGKEIKRMPIGLIRYAPGPLLHKVVKKDLHVPQFMIFGEFGQSIGIELYEAPRCDSAENFLNNVKGRIIFNKGMEISIPEFFSLMKNEDRNNVFNSSNRVDSATLNEGTAHSPSKKLFAFQQEVLGFYLSELGRKRLNHSFKTLLGKDFMTNENKFLTIIDVALAIIGLAKNWDSINDFLDDKLHLGNRRVVLLHHIVARSLYEGVRSAFKRTIRDEYNLDSIANALELSTELSSIWLDRYIKRATQKADTTNALSLLSQRRKLTFAGPEGIKLSYSSSDIRIRDIHPTHYGRICIVESTEGKGVGLNLQLAALARLRCNGEIETPYKMPDGQVKWFSAFDEIMYEAEFGKPMDVRFLDSSEKVLVHNHREMLKELDNNNSNLPVDVSFKQPYGPAALLIPFLMHCDGTRAMMGAKNMKQALMLKEPEEPLVRTGFEKSVGEFKLGINALVAYMPWKGFNFEDGIVCSGSFSKKMTTIHHNEVIVELFYGDRLIFNGNLPSLKEVGSVVESGDIIFKKQHGSTIVDIRSEFCGVLTRVERIPLMNPCLSMTTEEPFELYKAVITQERPLRVGDKIMGRHGNKGVIALILPDEEMPHLNDGTSIEVILNPNGVISRMNLSQILETHWGWVANNNKISLCPKDPEEVLKEKLKEIPYTDETGKVLVKFKVDGEEVERRIVVGLQYMMKLNHLSADKLKVRTTGRYNQLTGGAVKGDGGGQRLGEMEFWALRSFNADAIISEVCKTKNLVDKDTSLPQTSSSLDSLLKAMGIVVHYDKEQGCTKYRIADSDEISGWGPEIESDYNFKPKKIEVAACKLCKRPIILGACKKCKKEIKVSLSKDGVVQGECSCETKEAIGWQCDCGSSSALDLSINTWDANEKGLLDSGLFGKKGTDEYLKKFGYIKLNIPVINPLVALTIASNEDKRIIQGKSTYIKINFQDNNKCKVLSNLPVVPLAFRDPGKHFNDLHKAYNLIIQLNNKLITKKAPVENARLALSLQKAVYNLFFGDGKPNSRGLVGRLNGRKGLLRSAMIARRVDFSGRAVIVPAPELHIDECLLPKKFEVLFDHNLYHKQAEKMVLINRAATLHKYNILSFKVKEFWDEDVIGLPPLVCSYMNADFDGDTVAVHLPLGKEAYEDSLRMSPVNYLFGYASGNFMPHITQDIVLGLYVLAKSEDGRKEIATMLGLKLEDIASPLTSSKLKELCVKFVRSCANDKDNAARTINLSLLGFKHATISGATFSIFDVPTISLKERLELKDDDPDKWRDKVSEQLQSLSNTLADKDTNGVAWMIVSGARGGKDQIVQLGGMRGSMFRPGENKRIDMPVIGNFREGLKSYEYWISAPGTRKGMIDKHINTQPAGILHRTLVESGYPLEIVIEDCETKDYITISRRWGIPEGIFLGNAQDVPFHKRILGRTLGNSLELIRGISKETIKEGVAIDYNLAKAIEEDENIQEVPVRSPLLCSAKKGICSKCYGLSLDTFEFQKKGTPIGLIAGHIIGERGVQLTMRTFHTGGASVSEVISTLPWVRRFLGAVEVELPIYKVSLGEQSLKKNRWELLLFLLDLVNSVDKTVQIEEDKTGDPAMLSINGFLEQIRSAETKKQSLWSRFMHVMSFEILSIYSGDISTIHFETIFRSMIDKNGSFIGIFSKAGDQGSVLASASHDRAVQRIFKAAMDSQEDKDLPWREKFIRGLL